MTKRSVDCEERARAFPSPRGSRPARSLTYRCGGRNYLAVIGHQRRRWDGTRGAADASAALARAGPGSGNTVISIVATKAAIEIWSREPTLGWPNPSLVPHDAVLSIEFLDKPGPVTSLWPPRDTEASLAGGAEDLMESRVSPPLADRLAAAGAADLSDPRAAWLKLRAAGGRRATIIDLYELAGAPRGLTANDLPAEERSSLAYWAVTQQWPGFALTTDSKHTGEPIEVVDYNPAWPTRYVAWEARLSGALGAIVLRMEHVGSTAVPGLVAKPVIDIQISVGGLAAESDYVPQLEAAGVQLRSRDELHRYFRPHDDQPRELHVHVCAAGGAWEREHLLFRDHLRAHPDYAGAYARVKRAAARTWRDDRWAYTESKTAIILDILDSEERWAQITCWQVRS